MPTVWTNANPLLLPLVVQAGDRIYLKVGLYDGVFTVYSVSGQYITLDTEHLGNSGSGRLNLVDNLTNFRPVINIYHGVSNDVIDTLYPKTDSTGFLMCDVSGVIRSTVDTYLNANITDINRANKGISGSFKIGYSATYQVKVNGVTTNGEIEEVVDSYSYSWLSASKQIDGLTADGMDGIGQNLKDYVPKNLSGSNAKFLTMFETPTYFAGYPFSLSFLYDEDFSDVYLERHQQNLNINGGNVGSETDDVLMINQKGYVNNLLVDNPTGADSFDVWLETGDVVDGDYVLDGGIEIGAGSKYAIP